MRTLALDGVALRRLHREDHILLGERVLAIADRDPDTVTAAHSGCYAARVECRDRLRGKRHVFAEQWSERAVVGLHLILAQLVGRLHEAHLAYVQLLAHDLYQALDRFALGAVGPHNRL